MDQSKRYADFSLQEAALIAGGQHILCTYKMAPKDGLNHLETAAHFAAESSTGTNVEVCTNDAFAREVDVLVYYVNEATEDMRTAYPLALFDRNITDGRFMLVSFLTLTVDNNQGMGDIKHAKMMDFYVFERVIQMFDGPAKDISDLWRILGRPVKDCGFIVGTISKPKLGLSHKPLAQAAYQFWLGATSSKTTSRKATRCFRRSRGPCRWCMTRSSAPRTKPARPSCSR